MEAAGFLLKCFCHLLPFSFAMNTSFSSVRWGWLAAGPAAMLVLCALLGCEPSEERRAASTTGRAVDSSYADRMAVQHAGDQPTASPAAMEPDTAVAGREVTYGDGLTGYLAVPEAAVDSAAGGASGDEALPAVIAVHEWWGLNENIRTMARRLAGQGYRVLAADLYDDQVAESPQQARALMQQATSAPQALRQNLESAYQYLTEEHRAPQVGIIGWCFGGGMALSGALALPRSLDAVVIYYGSLERATREALQPLAMPILGFFGAQDQSIPAQRVRQFEQTLQELGKDAEVYIYDEAGHAFANPSGERYVPEAAEDAWQKTLAFFEEHLK